jgi:beta-xylosidase
MEHHARAEKLLSVMTLEEKIAQLCSAWLEISDTGEFSVKGGAKDASNGANGSPYSLIEAGIGQLTRPLGTRPIDPVLGVRGLNRIQKYLVERTRLGIPALAHEECLTGLMAQGATLFPAGINYGSLWDEELMRKIASAIGEELYSVGSRQGLSPVLDVSRDVRWGRTEESMGEDPYLVGRIASAYVQGLQGPDRRILATLKHYVGHSFSEGARNHAPVRIGERELNDVFILPFEMAVKTAHAGSIMPAYHDIDGEPCSSSRKLIVEVLRERWGFDGLVVSDYEALNQLKADHRVAADTAEAAALALKAGMDQELPSDTCYRRGLEQALARGLITMDELNAAVRRVLVAKSRLGLFERPYVDEGAICLNSPEHREVAAMAAERSIVLLSNDGTLPLGRNTTVALVGQLADEPLAPFSGYSFPVHLVIHVGELEDPVPHTKTLREALTERIGADRVLYARGCDVLTGRPKEAPVFPGDAGMEGGQRKSCVSYDESGIPGAVETAGKADVIVMAAGDLSGLFLSGTVGEGSDVSSLELPGVQGKLLRALLELGKPVVLVLMNGRPYYQPEEFPRVNAILESWLPGQAGPEAIARILCGEVSPGGRLPVSVPKSAGAMPYFYNYKMKSAGAPIQENFGAAYPFGHGLSYTEFRYSGFEIAEREVPIDGTVSVSVTVENTGGREGDEVVQLYVRDLQASLVRPVKELKAFKRITLAPGRSARITFKVPTDMLGFTVSGTTRIVEPGDFSFLLGRSSADILFRETVTLTGAVRTLPADWRMLSSSEVEYAVSGTTVTR